MTWSSPLRLSHQTQVFARFLHLTIPCCPSCILCKPLGFMAAKREALSGVIGIRDIWVKNYMDKGYLGGKLKGYGIFKKRFWDIEDRSSHFLKE